MRYATAIDRCSWPDAHEILEDVSALKGPQSQVYFACEASSFELEKVQALYLYLRQYAEGLSKG